MSDLGHEATAEQQFDAPTDAVELTFSEKVGKLVADFKPVPLPGAPVIVAKSPTDATPVLLPGKNSDTLVAAYVVDPAKGHPKYKGRTIEALAEFAISGMPDDPRSDATTEPRIAVRVRLGNESRETANQSVAAAMDAIQDAFEAHGEVTFLQSDGYRTDQILDLRR